MKPMSALVGMFLFAVGLLMGLPAIPNVQAGPYGIKCSGPHQIVQGDLISSPYCGDNYIAQVARSYGYHVSNRELRNNPNLKIEICQHVGQDSRIRELCRPYRYRGR